MGLDMYLSKKHYVKHWEHINPKDRFQVIVKKGGKEFKEIQPKRISYIEEEVGYWRKANAIHKWFVDNVQHGEDDCKTYYCDEDVIEKLLENCKVVRSSLLDSLLDSDVHADEFLSDEIIFGDTSKAEELLPASEGFFFGDTHYNQWYLEDIEYTIEVITETLKENTGDIYYSSSW